MKLYIYTYYITGDHRGGGYYTYDRSKIRLLAYKNDNSQRNSLNAYRMIYRTDHEFKNFLKVKFARSKPWLWYIVDSF